MHRSEQQLETSPNKVKSITFPGGTKDCFPPMYHVIFEYTDGTKSEELVESYDLYDHYLNLLPENKRTEISRNVERIREEFRLEEQRKKELQAMRERYLNNKSDILLNAKSMTFTGDYLKNKDTSNSQFVVIVELKDGSELEPVLVAEIELYRDYLNLITNEKLRSAIIKDVENERKKKMSEYEREESHLLGYVNAYAKSYVKFGLYKKQDSLGMQQNDVPAKMIDAKAQNIIESYVKRLIKLEQGI